MRARWKKKPGSALGANIRRLRERRGLTQAELAEVVGLGRTQITNIEMGRMDTTVTRLALLKDALGARWIDLMKGVGRDD